MIEQMNILVKYIRTFEEEHKDILDEYKSLQDSLSRMQQEVKLWAQEHGDAETELVKVTVTPAWKKWYDPEVLKTDRSAWMILHKAGAVKETVEVDKKIADELAREEKISREILAKAYQEQELTPRISVKIKE